MELKSIWFFRLIPSDLQSSEIAALVWSSAWKLCSLTRRKSQLCAPNRQHLPAGRGRKQKMPVHDARGGIKLCFIRTTFSVKADWQRAGLCAAMTGPGAVITLLLRAAVRRWRIIENVWRHKSPAGLLYIVSENNLTAPQQRQYSSRWPEDSPAAIMYS